MRKTIGLILWFAVLSGCALTEKHKQTVDQLVEEQRTVAESCAREDHCALDSPLLELGDRAVRQNEHHVSLLEVGEDALRIRLHLIRSARESVDFQYFLFRRDDTGELVMRELLEAARRGVKVRLLLDQLFSISDLEYLVQLTLAHRNFEIRFYNPTFHKAKTSSSDWLGGIACCFRRFNQRMHNKLFVVDRVVGITGGRNIADRYFDYDTEYNFKDRDVVAYGSLAGEMSESFDWFWESKISLPVHHLRDVARKLKEGSSNPLPPYELPGRLQWVMEGLDNREQISALFIDTTFKVDRAQYFSDFPRKSTQNGKQSQKDITDILHQILAEAEESIVIQSPYLVLSRKARKLFKGIYREKSDIEMIFSTNSLASTDAYTVYAISHKHKKHYTKTLGFHIYEFKPFPSDAPDFFPRLSDLIDEKAQGVNSGPIAAIGVSPTLEMPGPRSGLHGKSFVVDKEIAMIGSHNFDPRSEGFNTENGLIVWDQAFAEAVEAQIRRDIEPQNSWVVAMKPKVPLVSDVGGVIESVSRTLPVFDLWPFRSTSVYELKPEQEPVPPTHEEFHRRYLSVGSFPDVVLTRRQIQTMIISSFFGFLVPIL